jgi:hypothetical protein
MSIAPKRSTSGAGWNLDFDTGPAPGIRVVQFTPTGSACSITFGTGMPQAEPGSYRSYDLAAVKSPRPHTMPWRASGLNGP